MDLSEYTDAELVGAYPGGVTLESHRDGKGQAYLDTTTLHTDRGKIVFEHARAYAVPADVARWLIGHRDDVFVPEWGRPALSRDEGAPQPFKGPVQPRPAEPPSRTVPGQARGAARPTPVAERAVVDPEEQKRLIAEHLRSEGEDVADADVAKTEAIAATPPVAAPATSAPVQPDDDSSTGAEPPPGAPAAGQQRVVPQGFVAYTEDSQPRCLAAKADGSQCANPAKPGTSACGFATHVSAVEQLPLAPGAIAG